MSQARLNQSTFAARLGSTLACEKCGQPIAKGERYIWFKVGFRSRTKHVRHLQHPPLESERESSLMSGVYAGRESAEESIASAWPGDVNTLVDDLKSALESAADEWRMVSEQYAEAAEAMGEGAGANMQETADSIEYAADALTDWSPDEDEPDYDTCESNHEDHEDDDQPKLERGSEDCEDCVTIRDTWAQETQDSASNHLTDSEGQIDVSF